MCVCVCACGMDGPWLAKLAAAFASDSTVSRGKCGKRKRVREVSLVGLLAGEMQ